MWFKNSTGLQLAGCVELFAKPISVSIEPAAGQNFFSLERVRKVIAFCKDIRSDLYVLRQAGELEE